MKRATINAVPTHDWSGFAWVWRCSTPGSASSAAFEFYFDCITDVRKHGYEVEPTRAHGVMAPGGADYALAGPVK